MKVLKIFFLCTFFFSNADNFIVPSSIIGKWKTMKNEMSIFQVDQKSIYAIYNEGNISMNFKNILEDKEINLEMTELKINKIPKNIDYLNMWKVMKFIRSLNQNGLLITISEEFDEKDDVKKIYFKTGNIEGEFKILKLL